MALCIDNIFRGSKNTPSIFGIEQCSATDWSTLVAYIIFCVFIFMYSLKTMRREQKLKEKYGVTLAKSDIYLGGPQKLKLVVFSFFGGWVSGALGLGGGSIFNPLLLGLGVPPKVASSTGMYMMIWSTGASIITMIIQGKLLISYGLWTAFFCVFGSVIGMYLLNNFMRQSGRQSPLVFLLMFILGVSTIAVPYFGLKQLKGKEDIWAMGHICA